ncbi:RHS repeat-associated core domain-containing protein [Phytohabitans flavus]|uniref:Type IV secretion protein Rhs n=1 Tax=Phytohabitans flavus TaxID=1076124 RepID=A0A6F8XWH7_9ACTN|nr:RHS repeat-associated core domain-containing protein [Phytohabitans flavus]BCB78185.1 type IV secretion protein Rhs [Phytohabitans flavus]
MSLRPLLSSFVVVLIAITGLGHVPAHAADRNGPAAAAARPAAKGATAVPDRPKPDPSAARRLTRPDTVSWPPASTSDRAGLRVRTFDRAHSRRAGLDAPVFRVESGSGRITLSYAAFTHSRGGAWGDRLHLVKLPACAAVTPERAECQTTAPIDSANDPRARTLSADVAAGTVLTMSAGDASAQGDYKASKLSPSSSWSTSLASGAFTWNYPIRTPGTPGGLNPQVALSYSSQTVDGRNSATNNQGSWIGEGFTYEPGYIERRYKPCADDGQQNSAEQCWAFPNATIVLSGHSGELVRVDDNTWRLGKDSGALVQRLTGATNGDDDGEHWKLTTTDGMRYYFGLNRLPGFGAQDEETDSTWTKPVYGDDPDEPCHKASGFADSHCDQAWRWNLDHVVDRHGNVISYFYEKEFNHYARGGRTDVDGSRYVRGGYLTRIDYGQRENEVYSTPAPARVLFTTAERCIPAGAVDCDVEDLNDTTASAWPDVPSDLLCAPGTKCKATQTSTSFFTRRRLTGISTEIREGPHWTPVESWTLRHAFYAGDDNSRTLWLKQIDHTGHRGGTASMPTVELDGIQLANRVDSAADGIAPLVRYRLATVKTDTGGQISVVYAPTDCSASSLPTPGSNTKRCYPVRWNPFGGGEQHRVTDWFHKYVVRSVVEDDLVGGQPDMVSTYDYVGDAGWRKNEPDGITKEADLTWSDWRGYAQVDVRTGDGQVMPGRTEHHLLRGMSRGARADGTAPAVSVLDSTGVAHDDHDDFAGHELEAIVYDGASVVSKTVNRPWRSVTHTRNEGWALREAAFVRTDQVRSLTALAGGRWREARVDTTFDPVWGRALVVDDLGDVAPGKNDDDKCTRMSYVDNPAKRLYNLIARTRVFAVGCGVANPDPETHLLADTRSSYDRKPHGEVPEVGDLTKTESIGDVDGTTVTYAPTNEITALDRYGRTTEAKDAFGRVSTTEYTETDGLTTKVKTTNALDHSAYSIMDPAFGLATRIVDANDLTTEMAFDPLGRMTAVWLADRSRALGASPSKKFAYNVRRDRTSVVTTEVLANDGSYKASHEIYDGLLRLRQTQAPGAGGWLVTDTYYTGTGAVAKTNHPYLATGTGGDQPIVVPEGSVNGQSAYAYDGAGRVVAETVATAGTAKWSTTTSYAGDRVTVTPPDGGVPETTVTDARGNAVELHQHDLVTRYAYNRAGLVETVTDPAGNVWRYEYNRRMLKSKVEDPDAGTSTFTYNEDDRVASVTDGRGVKLSHKYDALGRMIETWQGDVGTGTKLTASKYDTKAKGQLHYTARYTANGNYIVSYEARDKLYRPLTTRYWIPGGDVGPELGKNYDFTTAYNTDGTVQSVGMPAAGGLAAEVLVPTYDGLGRPTAVTGETAYVTAAAYSDVNELLQAELHTGGTAKKAWLSWEFERGSGRLLRSKVDREGKDVPDMDARYSYDEAGNVLSISDTPAGGERDVQCFEYDPFRRMTEAWATADTCQANPRTVGGPAPYRHSWTFDDIGNRQVETIHGSPDRVRTYRYESNQPHTLRRIDQTGPARSDVYTYDPAGNTLTRPDPAAGTQELVWDAEGRLASSKPAGRPETTYVYDGLGGRIARKEPGAITLYIDGMELRLNTSTRAVTATRYYSFGGLPIAIRTNAGVFYQAGDHHGTNSITIDANSGTLTRRRTTPYGAVRGAPPTSWPDQKGFVGGTQDATGLTHLGARQYDTSIGRFISVDPLIDVTDPQQMHGYTYANANPVSITDKNGLRPVPDDGYERTPGGKKRNPFCNDEDERRATQSEDPGRLQRLREFRKKQILDGEFPNLLLALQDLADDLVDAAGGMQRTRGWARLFKEVVEGITEDQIVNTLIDNCLSRIDETRGNDGAPLGNGEKAAFKDHEFEIAFLLAWEGSEVVSKDDSFTAGGAANERVFDAWVDGVRSEFKTPDKNNYSSSKTAFSGAIGQNAARVYVHSKNISKENMEEGRWRAVSSSRGGPTYTQYRVVGWDTDRTNEWNTKLTAANEPVACVRWSPLCILGLQ